jgi:pantoate--beta-alanine ligase
MLVTKSIEELQRQIQSWKKQGLAIGFVPTMGALHKGHLALVENSVRENDVTIVSIFVNPLQFNNDKDLIHYPRDIQKDLGALEPFEVNCVFVPEDHELYKKPPVLSISFGSMESRMEGKFRPGHFSGVGLVVSKFFNIILPDRAYFGLKDLQQYLIIQQLKLDLSWNIEIIGVETVRESNGLAMSSRNERLSEEGKNVATHLYKGLELGREYVERKVKPEEVETRIRTYYESVSGLEIEYVCCVNGRDLNEFNDYQKIDSVALCVAGYVEGIRLIDNLYLRPN